MQPPFRTVTADFTDFRLLDTGEGYRLEQWGPYRLARPDPQAIWNRHAPPAEWAAADATFEVSGEKGAWRKRSPLPPVWTMRHQLQSTQKELLLHARLTPFKHTGIFAEQAANWEWMAAKAGKGKRKILNLFGYTGAATVLLSSLGHAVTHVDASRPAITWARENQRLNRLPEDAIRWMLDDAVKFVQREIRRGQRYDGIVMDPPAFGHSPSGQTWKFSHDLPGLLVAAVRREAGGDFLLINGYATNSSAIALQNLLEDSMGSRKGVIEHGELCLMQADERLISTGIFARWSRA
mgnify:CR=1 FL=1